MLKCICIEDDGNVPKMPNPNDSILKVISYFSQCEQMRKNIIEGGTLSGSKKRGKKNKCY
jgi:hypothetical protein